MKRTSLRGREELFPLSPPSSPLLLANYIVALSANQFCEFAGYNFLRSFWSRRNAREVRRVNRKRRGGTRYHRRRRFHNLPNIWLNILSKFTSFFFSRYLCITLLTLKQENKLLSAACLIPSVIGRRALSETFRVSPRWDEGGEAGGMH